MEKFALRIDLISVMEWYRDLNERVLKLELDLAVRNSQENIESPNSAHLCCEGCPIEKDHIKCTYWIKRQKGCLPSGENNTTKDKIKPCSNKECVYYDNPIKYNGCKYFHFGEEVKCNDYRT